MEKIVESDQPGLWQHKLIYARQCRFLTCYINILGMKKFYKIGIISHHLHLMGAIWYRKEMRFSKTISFSFSLHELPYKFSKIWYYFNAYFTSWSYTINKGKIIHISALDILVSFTKVFCSIMKYRRHQFSWWSPKEMFVFFSFKKIAKFQLVNFSKFLWKCNFHLINL